MAEIEVIERVEIEDVLQNLYDHTILRDLYPPDPIQQKDGQKPVVRLDIPLHQMAARSSFVSATMVRLV